MSSTHQAHQKLLRNTAIPSFRFHVLLDNTSNRVVRTIHRYWLYRTSPTRNIPHLEVVNNGNLDRPSKGYCITLRSTLPLTHHSHQRLARQTNTNTVYRCCNHWIRYRRCNANCFSYPKSSLWDCIYSGCRNTRDGKQIHLHLFFQFLSGDLKQLDHTYCNSLLGQTCQQCECTRNNLLVVCCHARSPQRNCSMFDIPCIVLRLPHRSLRHWIPCHIYHLQ